MWQYSEDGFLAFKGLCCVRDHFVSLTQCSIGFRTNPQSLRKVLPKLENFAKRLHETHSKEATEFEKFLKEATNLDKPMDSPTLHFLTDLDKSRIAVDVDAFSPKKPAVVKHEPTHTTLDYFKRIRQGMIEKEQREKEEKAKLLGVSLQPVVKKELRIDEADTRRTVQTANVEDTGWVEVLSKTPTSPKDQAPLLLQLSSGSEEMPSEEGDSMDVEVPSAVNKSISKKDDEVDEFDMLAGNFEMSQNPYEGLREKGNIFDCFQFLFL